MIARILAVMWARNLEFVRDRASLGWAVLTPFVLVIGLSFIFSGDDVDQYTVAVSGTTEFTTEQHPFFGTRYINFIAADDIDDAIRKISRHQLDLLLALDDAGANYWINPDSASAYIVERLLLQTDPHAAKQEIEGDAVRYVDWLVPGILGMNIMFGSLFGIGYVIVRYRKNGFLKRLQATPLSAFEFVTAQALSRLTLTLTIMTGVFFALKWLLDIRMEGSYAALLLVALLGSCALIALALVIAARVSSEELAGGLLNLAMFPMMLMSGVFFSLEGSPSWIQTISACLPLTQMLLAARAIMIDGAGLGGVLPQIGVLAGMLTLLLGVASALFKWRSV